MSQANGNVVQTVAAFARVWHHIDLKDKVFGRTSTRIALLLMGKHKPVYDPANDCGDYVVITNAKQVQVTGRKAEQKLYRNHTGWRLKEVPFNNLMQSKPDEIIRRAVSGMLPKNKLRDRRLERLKIFPDGEHPYEANILKHYDLQEAFRPARQTTDAAVDQATSNV